MLGIRGYPWGMTKVTKVTSRQTLLSAFDRLFDRAASKLDLDCSEQERAEARRNFIDRYDHTLRALDQVELPAIPESTVERMEEAIDGLSPAQVAGYIATGPLVTQVQKMAHALAARAAEQRLIEQLVANAEDAYGGN
jgi:hypothetical protein